MKRSQFELEQLDQVDFFDFKVAFQVRGDQVVLEVDLGDEAAWFDQLVS
jgi:hypothetical protein